MRILSRRLRLAAMAHFRLRNEVAGRLAAEPASAESAEELRAGDAGVRATVHEQSRGRGDTGPHPRAEVAVDAVGDGLRAPVRLETLEVQAQVADPRPEVRIVEPALVRVQRVVELPVGALQADGLRPLREN